MRARPPAAPTLRRGPESAASRYEGLWVVGPDGTGLRNLHTRSTEPGPYDGLSDPVWSPDGSLIMAAHGRWFEDRTVMVGLATIDPDGTHLRYSAEALGDAHEPHWGTPDC